jgi:isopenicillin N synthase-like dioxygenase
VSLNRYPWFDGDVLLTEDDSGDMLMSWSDDRFKSTYHRVKTPVDPAVDYFGPRYSLAFFNQPNADCKIQGPLKKYPVVTGAEFTQMAMKRNYEALQKTVAASA